MPKIFIQKIESEEPKTTFSNSPTLASHWEGKSLLYRDSYNRVPGLDCWQIAKKLSHRDFNLGDCGITEVAAYNAAKNRIDSNSYDKRVLLYSTDQMSGIDYRINLEVIKLLGGRDMLFTCNAQELVTFLLELHKKHPDSKLKVNPGNFFDKYLPRSTRNMIDLKNHDQEILTNLSQLLKETQLDNIVTIDHENEIAR